MPITGKAAIEMGEFFGNFRSKAKVATLAMVFLLSFSLYGLYCINTVTEVKINGQYYREIIKGKDVVADVLPPPAYLLETFFTAYQLLAATDTAEIRMLSERASRLRAEYLARIAHWQEALPAGGLKRALVEDSYAPAKRLLDAMDARFLPAIRAGDTAAARAVLAGIIRPEYDSHRALIDSVVALAEASNRSYEARADVAVRSRIYGQIVIGLLLFAFLSVFSSYVIGQEERERARKSEAGPDPKPETGPAARTRG